ncbi:MAG: MBL fold metallo-hydrolase, partial [Oscillospiraceae bacterium]|nr:MBL fold metallo-hydrolase [Oscillospiraceae bacterium]
LDTPEFYDEAVFRQFMTCMEEAIALFQKYNVVPTALIQPYDFIQDTLDAKEAELRAFASKLTVNIKKPSAASLNAKTTIHQLPSKQVRAEGDYSHNMSYIIQTRGGKIIIIDGGWEQDNSDGKFLFSYLQQITGDSTPHIDAWFITHAHGDHHGAVSTFANLYKDQVTIDAYYHHNPTEEELTKYMPTESITGVNRVSMQMKKFKNKEGGAVQQIKVNSRHSGKCNSSFDFDDVHIDILLDFSDIIWAADNVSGTFSGTWAVEGRNFKNLTLKELVKGNFNETSIVFRVSVGGKNVLFTGDAGYVAGYMLNKYHDAHASNNSKYYSIQSDYVQVAHHGYYGVTKATYNRIDPDVGLWPTPKYEYTGSKTELALPYALEWFAEMGVKNYPSYLGPQVFEFPVARSDAAISIPSELKPYVFDAEYYASKYPDLAELYGTDEAGLYYHFVNYGIEEGRSASPFFDVKYYAAQNTHHMTDTFRGNFVKAFNDFLSIYRTDTLRRWSPIFDATLYSKRHTDLAAQGYTTNFSLLKHYVNHGYETGEIASSTFVCDGLITTNHYSCTTTKAKDPTCTTAGNTFSAKCTSCDMVVTGGETIPATGHTQVVDPGVEPDCINTGLTEGKHCSVCNAVIVTQHVIPANGHTFTYTKVDGQTHIVGCANCDLSETATHSYVDGSCICGDVEIKEPVVDTAISIGHTLNLASDISINFAVRTTLLADYVNHYLVVEIPVYSGNEQTGTRTLTIEPVLNGNYYYYTLTGLTAVNMGDVVSAQLHMEKDGQEYLSKVDTYSVAQYAYSQLNKAEVSDKLKALCADLLRYGKEAQIYKSYRLDSLVDASMTEENKAYLSDAEAVVFGNTNKTLTDLESPPITWAGKSLILDSKVCLKFIFSASKYSGSVEGLTLRVSYTDTYGAEKTLTLADPELYNEKLGYYAFTLDTLLAAELRSIISVQVYAGDTPVSATLQYSPDTYGNNKTGQLMILCKALIAYSDTAKAYFT